jgi:hypothetical protein
MSGRELERVDSVSNGLSAAAASNGRQFFVFVFELFLPFLFFLGDFFEVSLVDCA